MAMARRWRGDGEALCALAARTDVDLKVPRRQLSLAVREEAEALAAAALLRPPHGGGRQWLSGVERRLEPLHVRGYHGRDALEAVGRERASEAQPSVHADAGGAIAAPPEEALRPLVCALDWAEPVCRLGVYHVRRGARGVPPSSVADGEAAGVVLRAWQRGAALVRLDACVDRVVATIAGVHGDARLEIGLHRRGGAPARGRHASALLQDHAAGQEPARNEWEMAGGSRHPALGQVGVHDLGRRVEFGDQAGMMEG